MGDVWAFGRDSGFVAGQALVGFDVESTDGVIGQVERLEDEPGRQHLVVDTGVWKFGRSVLIPAGAVTVVDGEEQKVKVAASREEIKSAPRFTTDSETTDHGYLAEVGAYYLSLRT
ncbi:PRC-barrel domain containing protein [Streptomyces globisporus]|uniref:PRC-barrel domain containing protein n=1 Tax=Streptomyces globisporus TaxID=1908 RepID=A0A423V6A9_STRGL|nr:MULTISPECIES: PRC-barrel domain containing protein [Streptomyces]ROV70164.1 PRC-barrel domain containing protein [Streptomyces globisporus]